MGCCKGGSITEFTYPKKFDPEGSYIRRWVPELARLPDRFIHQPGTADPDTLTRAGVRLGTDYPYPMVDHQQARQHALDAFQQLKQSE